MNNKQTNKSGTICAFWRYEGNHLDGKDHPRYGNETLANAAYIALHDYPGKWDHIIEEIPPSKAHCKREKSSFGQTYAYRIFDANKLLDWYFELIGRDYLCIKSNR